MGRQFPFVNTAHVCFDLFQVFIKQVADFPIFILLYTQWLYSFFFFFRLKYLHDGCTSETADCLWCQ